MAIVFRCYGPPNDLCAVCREPLNNQEVVVEHWNGVKKNRAHPIHLKCIEAWRAVREECPTCRDPLNLDSLDRDFELPWKSRSIKLLGYLKEDILSEREMISSRIICAIIVTLIVSIIFGNNEKISLHFRLALCTIVPALICLFTISTIVGLKTGARLRGRVGSVVGEIFGMMIPCILISPWVKGVIVLGATLSIMGIIHAKLNDTEYFLRSGARAHLRHPT